MLQAGDVHLGYAQAPAHLLLREIIEEAQNQHHALAGREAAHSAHQLVALREVLQVAILLASTLGGVGTLVLGISGGCL
jgi:hypothetical protein